MTRETDIALGSNKDADLINRAYFSSQYGAEYFVSIHVNSFEDSKVNGIEIYKKDDESEAIEEKVDNIPVDDDFSEEVEENNIVEQEDYTEDFSEDFEAEAFTEENDYEVVDIAGFSDYIEDDDEQITMSSLADIKKKKANKDEETKQKEDAKRKFDDTKWKELIDAEQLNEQLLFGEEYTKQHIKCGKLFASLPPKYYVILNQPFARISSFVPISVSRLLRLASL